MSDVFFLKWVDEIFTFLYKIVFKKTVDMTTACPLRCCEQKMGKNCYERVSICIHIDAYVKVADWYGHTQVDIHVHRKQMNIEKSVIGQIDWRTEI